MAVLTPDEVVATLKRTSLPTIITEGFDDYLVFRRIEERFADIGVSLMPVGGKQTLLEVFERRLEFPNIRFACVADRDMWLFGAVPRQYIQNNFVLTDGYSIENDLYRDGQLENMLSPTELINFRADCDALCSWFSFAVRTYLDTGTAPLHFHPERMLSETGVLCPAFRTHVGYVAACPVLFPDIRANYARLLRGKTLLNLLVKHLSYAGRPARHNFRALLEMASNIHGSFAQAVLAQLDLVMR